MSSMQPELWANNEVAAQAYAYEDNVAEADEAEERHSNHTQRWLVQTHLESGRTITALEALQKYGIGRLAARVLELRRTQFPVQSRSVQLGNGKRVAEYFMRPGSQGLEVVAICDHLGFLEVAK